MMIEKKVPRPRNTLCSHDSRGRTRRGIGVVMVDNIGSVASLYSEYWSADWRHRRSMVYHSLPGKLTYRTTTRLTLSGVNGNMYDFRPHRIIIVYTLHESLVSIVYIK